MREKIIIDCDPGQDDAVALFLAIAAPEELNILGITTVAGNVKEMLVLFVISRIIMMLKFMLAAQNPYS